MSSIYKIFLICVGLLAVDTLSAQTSEEWLAGLNSTLGERYAMAMTVSMGEVEDDELNGIFMVEGDGYYLSLGVMEVYSDGKLRYEVNNERKEATVDRVDLTSHDLLTNPTKAFSFADDEFQISLDGVQGTEATIDLIPREDIGITNIELRLKREGKCVSPLSIVYNYDGDRVRIELSLREQSDAKLPRWDKDAYRAYDVVSFL